MKKSTLMRTALILTIFVLFLCDNYSAYSDDGGFLEQMIDGGTEDLFTDLDNLVVIKGFPSCRDCSNTWKNFPEYPSKIIVLGVLGKGEWNRDSIAVYGYASDGSCLFRKMIHFACLDLDCSKYTIKKHLRKDTEQTINCEKTEKGFLIYEVCRITPVK